MPTSHRYDPVAIAFHWLTALAILAMLGLGWTMVELRPGSSSQFQLFQWHKSLGFTVLALATLRLLWRAGHRPPPLPPTMSAIERRGAQLGHWALYGLMLALPLSGWVVVSTASFNIPTLLYGIVPVPHIAPLASLADKAEIHELFEGLHETGVWTLVAILVVHVGAALRHHFLLGDEVLVRMLPRFRRHAPVVALAAALCWATPAAAAEWTIDSGASRLGFTGSQGGTPFDGRFTRWRGDIVFDPANPGAGHALVTIDTASATTDDRNRDEALPQADWFNAKTFPDAVFEATTFRAKGGNAYEAEGSLTIRGVSRPVTLPFTLDLTGNRARAQGRLTLVRTEFGIGQGSWSDGRNVALEVAVTVDLTANARQ